MKNAYFKVMWRSIKGTAARFLSILGISALGVGFLCGLLATTPDMQYTADKFYDKYRLLDIDIKSALGMTQEDSDALAKLDYISKAMPCYITDTQVSVSGETIVSRIYGLNLENEPELVNGFELLEGRLPLNNGECLIASANSYSEAYSVGDEFVIGENENYTQTKLVAVGKVRSPYYTSVESEPSQVGAGRVDVALFACTGFYNMPVYTDVFLTVKGAAELDTFSDKYTVLIESAITKLKEFGKERAEIRFDKIVSDAEAELLDATNEYNTQKNDAETALAKNKKKLDDGYTELESAKALLEAEITKSRAQLESVKPTLSEEQYLQYSTLIDSRYNESKKEIDSAQTELDSKIQQYNDAKKELETELESALKQINQARDDIDSIEKSEWYITNREDIISYASYNSNASKVSAIAKVFPVFFFAVAMLVALTTMTRLVEEERLKNGTLKALGYSKEKILLYYVLYGVIASLLGGVIGASMGFRVFPAVISNAYIMLYTMPETEMLYYPAYAIFTVSFMVICTVAATLWACLTQLTEKPSQLMLPKSPKQGKRILFERIGFIWRHLNFTWKVTCRNIFRYKKRLFMTVFGIAGCSALLVTGFGLRDSIHDIADIQFGQLYNYNLTLYLSESDATETKAELNTLINSEPTINGYALYHMETATVQNNDESSKINLLVPKNTETLSHDITLRERISKKPIEFTEDSCILTEKLCENLGIELGDMVELTTLDGKTGQFKVTGIAENYVQGYAFVSARAFEEQFKKSPDYTIAYVHTDSDTDSERDVLSQKLLACDGVQLTMYTNTIKETFSDTVKTIDYIVMVLIAAAGALAVIVLYNLTNINICERRKELATIKVLGFRRKEVASYIFREINILSVIGTLVGFGVGVWLHNFVVLAAEVDVLMFGRQIYLQSYAFAGVITLLFTFLVNLIMRKKLHDIDMVESMKAND